MQFSVLGLSCSIEEKNEDPKQNCAKADLQWREKIKYDFYSTTWPGRVNWSQCKTIQWRFKIDFVSNFSQTVNCLPCGLDVDTRYYEFHFIWSREKHYILVRSYKSQCTYVTYKDKNNLTFKQSAFVFSIVILKHQLVIFIWFWLQNLAKKFLLIPGICSSCWKFSYAPWSSRCWWMRKAVLGPTAGNP